MNPAKCTATGALMFSRALLRPLVLSRCFASKPAPKASDAVQYLEKEHARLLRVVERRVEERKRTMSQITEDMSDKDDVSRLKQVKESEPLQHAWDKWEETRKLLDETQTLLDDPDPSMRAMASEEYSSLQEGLTEMLESTFPALLLPPSTTSQLSALLELKSGAGGSEASLFLGELLRMYQRLAADQGWKADVVGKNENDDGGVKDAIVEVKGIGAYDALRWESGVHRVQRVPATESKGRVHTSAVAVLVLPLVEENDRAAEELFTPDEVKVEVMRSRGAGGQHVNKTESAVRLTHLPTGITVSMQDERSQHQNRRRAYQVLRSRLLDVKLQKDQADRRATRRNLVSGSDRSDKIRTYNFAQERVTDHRIGMTLMNLSSVLEGRGLHEFIDAIQKHQNESTMEEMLDVD